MASPPPAKKQRKKSPSPAASAVKREEDLDDETTLAEEDKVSRERKEERYDTDGLFYSVSAIRLPLPASESRRSYVNKQWNKRCVT
jgi:hypothetical protein